MMRAWHALAMLDNVLSHQNRPSSISIRLANFRMRTRDPAADDLV